MIAHVNQINLAMTQKNFIDSAFFGLSTNGIVKYIIKAGQVLLAIILIYLSYTTYESNRLSAILYIILGAVGVYFYPKIVRFAVIKTIHFLSKTEKMKKMIGVAHLITFIADRIIVKSVLYEKELLFEDIKYIKETEDYFFVVPKTRPILFFPKDQIENGDDLKIYFKSLTEVYKVPYNEDLAGKY